MEKNEVAKNLFYRQFDKRDSSRFVLSCKQVAEVERRLASLPDFASDTEVEMFFSRLTR
jgi:hypothetical protein